MLISEQQLSISKILFTIEKKYNCIYLAPAFNNDPKALQLLPFKMYLSTLLKLFRK